MAHSSSPRTDFPARLALATNNPGKAKDLRAVLAQVRSVGYSVPSFSSPEESADTFVANAVLKAEALAQQVGAPALGDDSGLEVLALGGAPGVESRRWAVDGFETAMLRLHESFRELPATGGERDARAMMVCGLAIAVPGQKTVTAVGRLSGQLVWPPRGTHRIGYEPMFQPVGVDQTLGEMDRRERAETDARARAFAELRARFSEPETGAG